MKLTSEGLVPNEPASVVDTAAVGITRVARLSVTSQSKRGEASGLKRSTCGEGGSKNESSDE